MLELYMSLYISKSTWLWDLGFLDTFFNIVLNLFDYCSWGFLTPFLYSSSSIWLFEIKFLMHFY